VEPPDPGRITAILRADAPAGPRVVAARPLAEAAGRRRVVRYEVEGLDPDRTVALIGKCYADRHRSWVAHENLRLLSVEVFAGTPRFAVPAPVRHLPALRLVLYREVAGTPLDRLPPPDAAALAVLAAGWLTTLHGSQTVLARRPDLTHEVRDVAHWAELVAGRAPGARAAAYALADRLATAAAELPAVPEVPVHRDFHAGHVLAVRDERRPAEEGGAVAVLDLDEARMGDPALDVAHFATCLDAAQWTGASAARRAFLTAYGPLPGPAPDERSAFFTAYTSMKIAKQLVTGRGPLCSDGRPPPDALTAVLRRGLSCLAG
jgi:hypothetical protein